MRLWIRNSKVGFGTVMRLLGLVCAALVPIGTAFGQGTWSTNAPMPTPRAVLAGGAVNGIVYAVGGQGTSGNVLSVVEAYDPTTDTWSTKASLPFPIERAAAAGVNGILYVVGGCADAGCGSLLGTLFAYDPTTNTWTQKASVPTPRRDFAVGALNGMVYALGGNQGPGYVCLTSVEAYDPATDSWIEKALLPVGRTVLGAGVVNGVLYAAGGATCNPVCNPGCTTDSSELDSYNSTSNTWATKTSMPIAVNSFATGAINGKFYAVGGDAPPDNQNQTYDTATDTWTFSPPMPTARNGPLGAVVGATLYTLGGANVAIQQFVGTNEAFTPFNTPTGTNIKVTPTDTTNGTTPVTLTYSSVTQAGNTTLTTSSSGPAPPTGFKLGNPPTYYQLSTTAVFSGSVTVSINYSGIKFGNASKLRLFHLENGVLVDVTTLNDTTNSIIYGSVTSLSPFAIFESGYTAAIQAPINADGSSVFNSKRGVVPVKFTLSLDGTPSCQLPTATISLSRTAGEAPGPIDESVYSLPSDSGSNFRIDTTNCQYVYNLDSGSLGPGTYLVQINISNVVVGSATFGLQ